jgi:Fur family transcriptional regulator, ferric uptake regulator
MESKYTQLLRSRKLKATPARLSLIQAIDEFEGAMPYSKIQQALAGLDRVTLYRNIKSLISKGIIHKAFHQENEDFYALCTHTCTSQAHNHQHIHFKCERCKVISCLEINQNMQIQIPSFQINSLDISASGICVNCL